MDYFEFFGLKPALIIDEKVLRSQYLKNQREWHPDFFSADPEGYEKALANTALNNQAYKTIGNLSSRVEYVLTLKELAASAEKNVLPLDFLSDMMDLNDLIDSGHNGNIADLQNAKSMLEDHEKENVNAMLALAQSNPELDAAEASFWTELQSVYQKMKYLSRLKKNLIGKTEM